MYNSGGSQIRQAYHYEHARSCLISEAKHGWVWLVLGLWFHTPIAAARINVALSGTAIQSSTINGGLAERSIDGNNDPQWEHNSCSITALQAKAWWRLELPGVNANRWRLNNVEILIGDSLSNNGNENPRCAIINDDPGCLTQIVKCWGMAGRFINFYQSSDAPEYLQLCEVKVYGVASRINVALSGTAIQSTTDWGGLAERSIDGNSDPDFEHYTCSITAKQAKPWWRLELPGVYRVSEIVVTNRNIGRSMLNNVEILIGDSLSNNGNDNPRCAIINDDPGCLTQTVKCWGMEGRFINFYRSSHEIEYLQLCEVKVYGVNGLDDNLVVHQKSNVRPH
uniref:Fucolectin tachylectin-4 pentraxin-1 domain-containing protein n=1 Tax=Gadus morhua TaxID=8049 RepID=A0A8C5CG61_GADMO